jgi:hypothetical protein
VDHRGHGARRHDGQSGRLHLRGLNGLSELPPINSNCVPWSAQCRIVIHYASAQSPTQLYIQAIWNLTTRPAVMIAGVSQSPTCIVCHNPAVAMPVNPADAFQVPAGQLDLTGAVSSTDPTIVNSYFNVLNSNQRPEQSLSNGILLNTVPEPGPPGPTGQPTTIEVTVDTAGPWLRAARRDRRHFLGCSTAPMPPPTAGRPAMSITRDS